MLCKLCGEEAELRNSHIISEFCYRFMYDEKHRFFELSTNPDHKTNYLQKGLREKLFCDTCEQKFNEFETYVSTMFDRREIPNNLENDFIVKDIDYNKLKLFQLSILFRIAVSSLDVFKQIKIPDQEQEIRDMLVNDYPGGYNDFGCSMTLILNKNDIVSDFIDSPTSINKDRSKYIRVIFGGFIWIFSLQKGENKPNNFLRENGDLYIHTRQFDSLPFIHQYANNLDKVDKLES